MTATQVRQAEARERGYKLADQLGLYLYVTPAGSKSWRFKYRYAGREGGLRFGLFPDVGIKEARGKRDKARAMLQSGINPGSASGPQWQSPLPVVPRTFEALAREWLSDHEALWSPANAFRVRSRLEKDVFPFIGRRTVGNVDGQAVLNLLRSIEARGSIETAKRVRGYILAILKRGHAEAIIPLEPVLSVQYLVSALKPAPPVTRQPAMTRVRDLLEFQQAVDQSTASNMIKLASRLLSLTAVRVGALCMARWSDFEGIDWERCTSPNPNPVWRIPASGMKRQGKNKENPEYDHLVSLSRQAIDTLRAVRRLTGHFEFVFTSRRSCRAPMTDAALSSLYKRIKGGRYKNRMVPHGWRSAFSTILNERAALEGREGDRLLIDMALGHLPVGVSASEWAYNRAKYEKPRATLFQAWADLISEGSP